MPARRLLPGLALVLWAGLPWAGARSDDGRATETTEHFVLTTSGPAEEAAEWSRVLEAAWPQMTAFFGAAPKLRKGERLQVAVFEDAESFRAAIRAGGGNPPSSGGYYCPVAQTSYLWRQPTRWYTRNLLLHETAHQFHYRARTGNDRPDGVWYVEGVAEHLGSHTWDGTDLRLGVTPLASLEDRAAAALEEVSRPGFSLRQAVEAAPTSRPVAMFLVRFLREARNGRRRESFDTLARKLDRGGKGGGRAFFAEFGKEKTLLAEFREWLPTVQQPMSPVFNQWDARAADHVRGEAPVVSTCRTRGAARRIAATLHLPAAGPIRAGMLLSQTDGRNYTVAFLTGRDGSVDGLRVDRRVDGKWRSLPAGRPAAALPEAPGAGITVAAERTAEGRVRFLVEGQELASCELPAGPLGLALDNCTVDFREIRIQPAE